MTVVSELLNLNYLVYSSYKTGTQTLVRTLNGNGLVSKHCHALKHIGLEKGEFESLLDQYLTVNNKKLEVVTVFREPLARHASSFFQRYGSKPVRLKLVSSVTETIIYKYSIEQLQEKFLSELRHRTLPRFRESIHEIFQELCVDTHELRFNRETGIGRFETRNVKLHMLRFDTLFADPVRVLGEITGKDMTIMPTNVGEKKWYSSIYSDFKASLVVPSDIAREVYADNRDLLDLFYTEADRPGN